MALVDADMVEELSAYKWHLTKGYAQTNIKGKSVGMHRMVNKTPDGLQTDHKNGVRLDNRRCNLRSATAAQNQYNRGATRLSKSGFKGVRAGTRGMYEAAICFRKLNYYLGEFRTAEEAALVYDKVAESIHGEFAKKNFT